MLAIFTRPVDEDLVGEAIFYWSFLILGFPSHNVGEMDFLSPVTKSDRRVALR